MFSSLSFQLSFSPRKLIGSCSCITNSRTVNLCLLSAQLGGLAYLFFSYLLDFGNLVQEVPGLLGFLLQLLSVGFCLWVSLCRLCKRVVGLMYNSF